MSDLFIKQSLVKSMNTVDALILDIDGVVLDVSGSFRVAIAQTAQFYATNFMEVDDTGPVFDVADGELFKMVGGFNSDWDLTNAVVALLAAKQAISGAKDTESLRGQEPTWAQFTEQIRRRGGGLVAAEKWILDTLNATQRRDFTRALKPKLVTQIFQEFYAGDGSCRALYGFEPEYIHGEPLYKRETVLLDVALLPKGLKLGVVTGRTRSEARLALKMSQLAGLIPEAHWITEDDGVRKPDGRTMLRLLEQMPFKHAIYVGDTMDDHKTVINYREVNGSGKAKITACTALSGPSGEKHRQLFLEAGAEIVTPDVNMLLQYLNTVL